MRRSHREKYLRLCSCSPSDPAAGNGPIDPTNHRLVRLPETQYEDIKDILGLPNGKTNFGPTFWEWRISVSKTYSKLYHPILKFLRVDASEIPTETNPPGHGDKNPWLKNKWGKQLPTSTPRAPTQLLKIVRPQLFVDADTSTQKNTGKLKAPWISKRNLLGMYVYSVCMAYHHMDRSWDTTPWYVVLMKSVTHVLR